MSVTFWSTGPRHGGASGVATQVLAQQGSCLVACTAVLARIHVLPCSETKESGRTLLWQWHPGGCACMHVGLPSCLCTCGMS